MDAARRVELSFQTPHSTSNANQLLDEWKVTQPNAFVSSTATKSSDPQSLRQQQRRCYTCRETNHLLRYCPKHRKDNSKQPEICRNQTARKMVTSVHMVSNTSVSAVTNTVVKLSKHTENRPSSTARMTSVPPDEVNSLRQQLVVLSAQLEIFESQCLQTSASSMVSGSANPPSPTLSSCPTPVTSDQPSTCMPLFGLPGVTNPSHTAKPEAQFTPM